MIDAARPVANTLAGDLIVYVIFPLVVVFIIGAISWVRMVTKRLTIQDQSLAMLIAQVMPPNQPSLKDLVNQINSTIAVLKDRSDQDGSQARRRG